MSSECRMQNSGDYLKNEEVKQVIEELTPRIKSSIRNTAYQEREDLEQEIIIKIIEKIRLFERKDSPGFWDFVQAI
ncbi:hypothetical protein GCM10008986_34910 [Salinibacillus aidingensis]|uniref:Helix-turn-helix domain-containing protein n=1 Tax=Salinibacillus aidingensis TaxID=237684 RepID=A0ABN1BS21_9BACI